MNNRNLIKIGIMLMCKGGSGSSLMRRRNFLKYVENLDEQHQNLRSRVTSSPIEDRKLLLESDGSFWDRNLQSMSFSLSNVPSSSMAISNAPSKSSEAPTQLSVSSHPSSYTSPSIQPAMTVSSIPTSFPSLTPTISSSNKPSIAISNIPTSSFSNMPSNKIHFFNMDYIEACNITGQAREEMILATLRTVSNEASLSEKGSPQNMAAEWILSVDEEIVCPDDFNLVQRYVLALLYFSTDGDNWTQCNQFDETCGLLEPFLGKEKYLSKSHECQWAGSTCDTKQHIVAIDFELNNMAGSIPYELVELTFLETLIFEQNGLSGTIPTQLGNLPALTELDLCANELTGTIPEQIYNIQTLQILDFDDNHLTGSLSSNIGNLANLQLLQLQRNFLTGTIPSSLGELKSLIVVELYQNDLSGEMPSEVCGLRIPPQGNGILLGLTTDCFPDFNSGVTEVTCSCCSECFFDEVAQ